MKAHYLQHVPFEDPGYISEFFGENNIPFTGTKLFENNTFPDINTFDILIVMGGPMGIFDYEEFPWLKDEQDFIKKAISSDKKIIGICLGAQLIAYSLGADIYKNKYKEIGWFPLKKDFYLEDSFLKDIIPENFTAFHWHGDTFDLPEGAISIASSEACKNQGFIYNDKVFAFQFHLESTEKSIHLLIENCEDELDGSRYVQDKERLYDKSFLQESNLLMKRILKKFITEK
jgi:GMP synthase-like glutamine amidotransferase